MELHHLPTTLIGRDETLTTIRRHFAGGARAVVLTSIGGIGKSAVARRLLEQERQAGRRAVWCALGQGQGVDPLLDGVAAALGATVRGRTSAARASEIGQALVRMGRGLLVLDGIEGLLPAALGPMRAWPTTASELTCLITSREWVDLPGAVRFGLEPLSIRADGAQPSPAAQLFEARAAGVVGFSAGADRRETVERIVRAVDGIPLAIELAASRLALFDVDELHARLDRDLSVLANPARGRPDRHRAMTHVIDWSWRLLPGWARDALTQCSLFAGPFDLDDAEAVLDVPDAPAMDALQVLIQASLVCSRTEPRGAGLEYHLLGPVRRFARDQLAADPRAEAHRARYATRFTEDPRARAVMLAPNADDAVVGWLDSREAEFDQLIAHDQPVMVRLKAALCACACTRARANPVLMVDRLEVLVARAEASIAVDDSTGPLLASACNRIAFARLTEPGFAEARAAIAQAYALAERFGPPVVTAVVESMEAYIHWHEARGERARALIESALARTSPDEHPSFASILHHQLALTSPDRAAAIVAGRRALALATQARSAHLVALSGSSLAARLIRPDERAEQAQVLAGASAAAQRAGIAYLGAALAVIGSHRHIEEQAYTAAHAVLDSAEASARGIDPLPPELPVARALVLHAQQRFEDAARACDRIDGPLGEWCAAIATAEISAAPDARERLRATVEAIASPEALGVRPILDLWTTLLTDPEPLAGRDALDDALGAVPPTDALGATLHRLIRRSWLRVTRHPTALLVGPRGFWPPGEAWVDLGRRKVVRGVLRVLAERAMHAPGVVTEPGALIRAVWPHEARPDTDASRSRLYAALYQLRELGLRDHVTRTDDGWLFGGDAPVVRVAGRGANHS